VTTGVPYVLYITIRRVPNFRQIEYGLPGSLWPSDATLNPTWCRHPSRSGYLDLRLRRELFGWTIRCPTCQALRIQSCNCGLPPQPPTPHDPWSGPHLRRPCRFLLAFLILSRLTVPTSFQYRDSRVISKLKEGSGDKFHVAVDTISEPNTQATTVRLLAENKPGKVIVILPASEEAQKIRKDVEVIGMCLFVPQNEANAEVALIAFASHFRPDRLWSGQPLLET
jgi:hypothetical protein